MESLLYLIIFSPSALSPVCAFPRCQNTFALVMHGVCSWFWSCRRVLSKFCWFIFWETLLCISKKYIQPSSGCFTAAWDIATAKITDSHQGQQHRQALNCQKGHKHHQIPILQQLIDLKYTIDNHSFFPPPMLAVRSILQQHLFRSINSHTLGGFPHQVT